MKKLTLVRLLKDHRRTLPIEIELKVAKVTFAKIKKLLILGVLQPKFRIVLTQTEGVLWYFFYIWENKLKVY